MSKFKLVPAQMHLDRETIGAINFHCGDGADGQFGEYSHGLLWIGTVTDDDGKEVYGLHLATAEYPEEGSTTLVEFAAPAPPACGDAEVKRFHLDATDGQLAEMVESQEGHYCEFEHVTRLTAERDALQLLLNDRDEQLHTLEQSRRAHFENSQAAERRIDLLENALREIVHNYNHGHLQHTHKAIVAAEELIEPAETEPDQGIPGTSFQRLNMLANQGE